MEKADQARFDEEMKNYIPLEKDGGSGQAGGSTKYAELEDEDYEEMDEEEEEDDDDEDYVRVKDSNKPKGRTSAYAFFIMSCKEELQNKDQSTPKNLSTYFLNCSEQWKALSPSEKKKFEDMAKADQVRYDREMKNYIPPKSSKKKRKKDSNKPRRPLSAFFIFCAEHRNTVKSEYPSLTIGEIARKLVEIWSKLSAAERAPYEQKAALLREKYEKDCGPGQAGGSTKDTQTEADNDDYDEDEDDDEEEEDDNDE
ncbi:high mobility group protein B2-like isoform X2 [Salminus brasiliensis]